MILSIANNNPIDNAKEATQKNNDAALLEQANVIYSYWYQEHQLGKTTDPDDAEEYVRNKLQEQGFEDYEHIRIGKKTGEVRYSYLPTNYTELEYLESTGTQYIDTGVNADNKLGFDCKVYYGSGRFGAWNYKDNQNHRHHMYVNGGWGFGLGDANYGTYHPKGDIYSIQCNYLNNYLYKENNIELSKLPKNDFDTAQNFWLFSRNPSISFMGRIYYFRITYEDTLVRNFIPAKNLSGTIGMYDIVNYVFYTNAGEGEFVAGDEI